MARGGEVGDGGRIVSDGSGSVGLRFLLDEVKVVVKFAIRFD